MLKVLEDGGHTRELQAVIQPIRCIGNLALGRFPNAYTHHISKPNPNLANRILPISTGRLLGGGSSVNCAPPVCFFKLNSSSYLHI